jgi:hypothetical protein
MRSWPSNVRLVGFCAITAMLLAATWAGAIGKAEKPRPNDQPMAMGEPPPQGPDVDKGAEADTRGAAQSETQAPERQPTAGELIEAEGRKHLRRMARINRIQVLGIEGGNQRLVDLARELRDAETERHDLAMKRLERALPGGGER